MEQDSNAAAVNAAPPVDPSLPLGPRRKAQAQARPARGGMKRAPKPKAIDAPKASTESERETKAGGDGGQDGISAPVVIVPQDAPRVPVKVVKPTMGKAKGKVGRKGKATVGKDGEGEGDENKGKVGRPPRSISDEDRKKTVRAIALGMPLERAALICGFPSASGGAWQRYLDRNPDFRAEIDRAKGHGEADLLIAVEDCSPGWQGKAWLLERARGYTMRAGIEHSGPNGRPLSVVAQVFTTLEAPGK